MNPKSIAIGIFIILILLTGSYFLFQKPTSTVKIASYSTSDKDRPKIEVSTTFADVGKIKVSELSISQFTIKNKGTKPLQLSNISSSCGCTTGQIVYQDKESDEFGMHSQSDTVFEIAPGDSATVKVNYRPYVMPVYGTVTRNVYINTNDPEIPKLDFKVAAFVQ